MRLPGVDLTSTKATHYSGYLEVKVDASTVTKTYYYYVQHANSAKPLLVRDGMAVGCG